MIYRALRYTFAGLAAFFVFVAVIDAVFIDWSAAVVSVVFAAIAFALFLLVRHRARR